MARPVSAWQAMQVSSRKPVKDYSVPMSRNLQQSIKFSVDALWKLTLA